MKKFLKGAATILTMAALPLAIAACNKTGETSQNPINPGGDPIEKTFTIDEIYNDMNVSLDVNQLLAEEAQQLADRAFGNGKEIIGFNVDDGLISVVAEVTSSSLGSVTATISTQTRPLLEGDVKSSAIERAGYTGDQEIAESQKAQAVENLTQAIEYIEQRICKISDGNINRVNYYPFEQTMQTGNLLCVFGPVRSDGTFVKLDVSENGEIVETVILVQGAKDMQPEEVYDAYQNGAEYVSSDPRIIDTSKAYTSPPTGQLQPDPDWGGSNPDDPTPGGDEETITIGEIFDQNFANIDFNDKLNDMFVDIVKIGYPDATSVDPMFYDENGNKTTVYYEMIRGGKTHFGGMTFPTPDGLPNGENLEAVILQQLGLNASTEVPVDETDKYVSLIGNAINSYDPGSVADGLTITDLQNKIYGSATNNSLPAPSNDFGEALMQDIGASGTIIATYVGDLSGRDYATGIFDAGYLKAFDVVVVYQNGDEISIVTTECLVPWYTNSTNQSQYEEFVKDGGTYKLRDTQTTTIENPIDLYVMVNENDSSLMGVMLKDKHSKAITDMFLV